MISINGTEYSREETETLYEQLSIALNVDLLDGFVSLESGIVPIFEVNER